MKIIILFILLQVIPVWQYIDTTTVKQDSVCLDSNYQRLIMQLDEQETKIDSLLVLIQKKMEE